MLDRDWSQRHKYEPRYQILSNKTSNKVIIQQSGEVDLYLFWIFSFLYILFQMNMYAVLSFWPVLG